MKISFLALLLIATALTINIATGAAHFPALTGRVVDEAGLLTPDQRQALEKKLEDIERRTSVQIVIATIPSLEGEPIEDYSIRLAQQWRIGQKGLDNGVIILVAKAEHKIRIEVGYGLEPVIPDGLAGRIIREQITPYFRANDYYGGLNAAVDGLVLAAKKEYPEHAVESPKGAPVNRDVGGLFFCLFIAGIIWFTISRIFAGAGCLIPYLVSGILAAFLLPIALLTCGWIQTATAMVVAPFGFVFGILMTPILRSWSNGPGSRNWKQGRWTSPTYYPGRGGGWGGGSGGGGFSGGGGGFGGGGASGGW
jgi:uncharacterized protein